MRFEFLIRKMKDIFIGCQTKNWRNLMWQIIIEFDCNLFRSKRSSDDYFIHDAFLVQPIFFQGL